MSRIQQQLAAIHLLTESGDEAGVSAHAVEHAAHAFEQLAADIFCPGASAAQTPTQDQKELLHAVLSGTPLGPRANAVYLQAIEAHMRGAQVTGVFTQAQRAYLGASARVQRLAVPPAPVVACIEAAPADIGQLFAEDPVPSKSCNYFGLQPTVTPEFRADGSNNLVAADFQHLDRYELYAPDVSSEVLARGSDELTSLHSCATCIATPKAYASISEIKLLSTFLQRAIRVWSRGAKDVRFNPGFSSEGHHAEHPPVDVIQNNGIHFNALMLDAPSGAERVAHEDCMMTRVPGDGNCLYYSAAYATNRSSFRDAYELTWQAEHGNPRAREQLIALIRRTHPNYRLNTKVSSTEIFYGFAQDVAHNFRQDVVADISARPERYAPVLRNRLRQTPSLDEALRSRL